MITRVRAIQIASDNFPKGPEALAEHLSVEVRVSPLNGVEGWCIRGPTTIVRLNQNSSEVRRRFTLAHELAHLVLGTDPDIALEPFRSDQTEEREADRLFVDDYNFRQSVAASLGVTKNKCEGQTLDQAFDYFMQTCPDKKYTGDRSSHLKSVSGQRYVRLYLSKWFP